MSGRDSTCTGIVFFPSSDQYTPWVFPYKMYLPPGNGTLEQCHKMMVEGSTEWDRTIEL